MGESVVIDCFVESVKRYREGYAVVAVDVIRATTMAITSVSMGRRCFPVPTLEAVVPLTGRLENPLLVGELGGNMPYGFDLNNSPVELSLRNDVSRPMILLSTSGTALMYEAGQCDAGYAACFRNHAAAGRHLIGRHRRVAVIGAGSRGEFREEDQMCCAWIAETLIQGGYQPEDKKTVEITERWSGVPPDAVNSSKSAEYLRRTGQLKDLAFILTHINDIQAAFMIKHDELVMVPTVD